MQMEMVYASNPAHQTMARTPQQHAYQPASQDTHKELYVSPNATMAHMDKTTYVKILALALCVHQTRQIYAYLTVLMAHF
jgi:hypothetical protein